MNGEDRKKKGGGRGVIGYGSIALIFPHRVLSKLDKARLKL
jgi:hypothetical protein